MYPSWAVGPVLDRPPPPCTVSGSSHHSTLTLWVSAQISTDFLLCRLKEGREGWWGIIIWILLFTHRILHPVLSPGTSSADTGSHHAQGLYRAAGGDTTAYITHTWMCP